MAILDFEVNINFFEVDVKKRDGTEWNGTEATRLGFLCRLEGTAPQEHLLLTTCRELVAFSHLEGPPDPFSHPTTAPPTPPQCFTLKHDSVIDVGSHGKKCGEPTDKWNSNVYCFMTMFEIPHPMWNFKHLFKIPLYHYSTLGGI